MDKMTLFTNWTEDTFTWSWDGNPWTFKAGESKWLDDHLAKHFAKHLANRELINQDKPTNHPSWEEYFKKSLGGEIKAETPEALRSVVKEREMSSEATPKSEKIEEKATKAFCNECDSKGGRHKKVCPTNNVKPKDEDASFEGLK